MARAEKTGAGVAIVGLLGVAPGALLPGGPAVADEIVLVNGSVLQVDAWRDVGDAIEFARSGGIIRISKSDIARIEGRTTRSDLRMYSAPAGAGRPVVSDQQAAAREMLDLLRQGEALFGQSVLSAQEKASALRRLGERWRDLAVADAIREVHAKGQRALLLGLEAYTAESEGSVPDARQRVESARTGLQEVLAEVRKLTGDQG